MSRTIKLTFAALAVMLLGLALFVLKTVSVSADGEVVLDISENSISITETGEYIITQSDPSETSNTITVSGENITITIQDLNISGGCPIEIASGSCTIILVGENKLTAGENQPGIKVETGASLTVNGSGSLEAAGGEGGAGIGGGRGGSGGIITINGGKVIAAGGKWGAGIGGGPYSGGESGGNGGTITISGDADVTAQGGYAGAGIGGGGGNSTASSGGNITISGNAKVKATGGDAGAGIGGGPYGSGGTIRITGGKVTAKGGDAAAGIGGGQNGGCGTVIIDGGTITAEKGGGSADDIGNGHAVSGGLDVRINGGIVNGVDYDKPAETTPTITEPTVTEPVVTGSETEPEPEPDGSTTTTFQTTTPSETSHYIPAPAVTTTASVSSTELLLAELAEAKDGDTVTFEMSSGDTTVDKAVFEAIAGRDITIIIELDDKAYWTINGKDVEKSDKIDLGVTLNTKFASENKIKVIAGNNTPIPFTLEHSGELGFTGYLNISVDKAYDGQFANLYYYNKGEFEFMESSEILDGYARFTFDHASDYVIVIDKYAYGDDVSSAAKIYAGSDIVENTVPFIGVIVPITVSAVLIMKLRRKRND